MRTTVDYKFVADAITAKWTLEGLGVGVDDLYTVPDLAKWSGVQADALEAAARGDDRFQVISAADAPAQFTRVKREGKNATGYWPFVRLRPPAEVAAIAAHRERAGRAGEILASTLRRATGVETVTVLYDKGRFVVLGLSPDEVASAMNEAELIDVAS